MVSWDELLAYLGPKLVDYIPTSPQKTSKNDRSNDNNMIKQGSIIEKKVMSTKNLSRNTFSLTSMDADDDDDYESNNHSHQSSPKKGESPHNNRKEGGDNKDQRVGDTDTDGNINGSRRGKMPIYRDRGEGYGSNVNNSTPIENNSNSDVDIDEEHSINSKRSDNDSTTSKRGSFLSRITKDFGSSSSSKSVKNRNKQQSFNDETNKKNNNSLWNRLRSGSDSSYGSDSIADRDKNRDYNRDSHRDHDNDSIVSSSHLSNHTKHTENKHREISPNQTSLMSVNVVSDSQIKQGGRPPRPGSGFNSTNKLDDMSNSKAIASPMDVSIENLKNLNQENGNNLLWVSSSVENKKGSQKQNNGVNLINNNKLTPRMNSEDENDDGDYSSIGSKDSKSSWSKFKSSLSKITGISSKNKLNNKDSRQGKNNRYWSHSLKNNSGNKGMTSDNSDVGSVLSGSENMGGGYEHNDGSIDTENDNNTSENGQESSKIRREDSIGVKTNNIEMGEKSHLTTQDGVHYDDHRDRNHDRNSDTHRDSSRHHRYPSGDHKLAIRKKTNGTGKKVKRYVLVCDMKHIIFQ